MLFGQFILPRRQIFLELVVSTFLRNSEFVILAVVLVT